MGRFAFYAPMKPPTHPTPSGDRQMARALMAVLGDVELVSELRLYDGKGDAATQSSLQKQAKAEAARLIASGKKWQAWITYHNYYKAPDIIGPLVSHALGIPYIQIESTRSPKRLNGPWAQFAALSEAAADHADLIFYFTDRDHVALEQHKPAHQTLTKLHPFLPIETLPDAAPLKSKTILTVAMLRSCDKLASFAIIAKALPLLTTPDWQLQIVGDGPERSSVEALFAPFKDQITFLGQQDRTALDTAYNNASAFLWPGVNEAFGMVYLEAQAAGLPVVAQDRSGVRDVVHPDGLVAQDLGTEALAKSLDALLQSQGLRQSRGQTARSFVAEYHLLGTARKSLFGGLRQTRFTRT